MLDQLIGLLLLGLGVNRGIYTSNQDVKGDQTVASAAAAPKEKKTYRLNPKDFENDERHIGSKAANTAAIRKFDTHAFGLGVLKMQEDFADSVEASREAARQEFEQHKTEFTQKLSLIKDTKKQAVVDRLNTHCQDINTQRTDKMTAMLGKLSLILTNVTNRAVSASAAGKDISTVNAAIATAQTAIADAQFAVANQAGAACTITITSATSLKTDIGKQISGLQQDLKAAYEKVIAARKSVGDAIRALAQVTGESLTSGAPSPASSTSSATQ